AMAFQRLGKYTQANNSLKQANLAAEGRTEPPSQWRLNWPVRLSLELLRDEAEQLIYGKGRHRPVIDDLIAKSEWQAALDRLDALGKDSELNGRDWTNRGHCHRGLSQWDQALAAYDKAIALGDNVYDAWRNKGLAHNRKGEYQKALAAFDRAEQVMERPQSLLFHERAVAYNGLRQYDKALAAADRAIELGDQFGWIRYHRGEALAGAGKLPAAIEDLRR